MPINSRFGRPSAIVVPGARSHTGAQPSLGDPVRSQQHAEFLNHIDQVVQANKDRRVLIDAGYSAEVVDNLSKTQLQETVKNLMSSRTAEMESKKQGQAAQRAIEAFQKGQQQEEERLSTPLDYQFGGKTITKLGGEQITDPRALRNLMQLMNKIHSKGGTTPSISQDIEQPPQLPSPGSDGGGVDSEGNILLDEINVTGVRDRETFSEGETARDYTTPKRGIDLLADAFQSLKPTDLDRSQDNKFIARLIEKAGSTSAGTAVLGGRVYDTVTDPVTGITSMTGISQKDSENLVHKYVPHPETLNAPPDKRKRPVQAFLNPRTGGLIYLKDHEGNFVTKPFPDASNITFRLKEKSKLFTLKQLQEEHDLALTNFETFERIARDYDPRYLTYLGQNVKLPISEILDKFGHGNLADPEYKFLLGATNFLQGVEQAFFLYRKFITGVAGGEVEMKRIEKAFVNRSQGPKQFEAAMNRMRMLYKDTLDIVNNTTKFVESKRFSLSQAQTYRREQVRTMLQTYQIDVKTKEKNSFDEDVKSLRKNLSKLGENND